MMIAIFVILYLSSAISEPSSHMTVSLRVGREPVGDSFFLLK